MNSKFAEMMAKKKDMKPSEKKAKMGVLHDLKSSLADSMADKMDGMKKVSVMSNTPEGMNAGLDKAKQLANKSSPDMDQDPDMMSDGGMAGMQQHTDSNEEEHTEYSGTPHDDGFMSPNPNEAYSTGMSMDNDNKSAQDSDEPEHVMYDGSSDQEMGPGYADGGMIGPNEALAEDVTYSGDASEDDGFKHPDSDESDHGDGYSEGGEVANQMKEAADSVQDEREETEGDAGDDDPPEFKGMSLQQVEEKLQHLLRMKRQMEKQ
jgi:hypothetical protein